MRRQIVRELRSSWLMSAALAPAFAPKLGAGAAAGGVPVDSGCGGSFFQDDMRIGPADTHGIDTSP